MLLDNIETYLKTTRMPPTRFGREAVGDPNFVFNLRDGRRPRAKTARKVQLYLEQRGRAERGR